MLPPTSYDKPSFPTRGFAGHWIIPDDTLELLCFVYGTAFVESELPKARVWLHTNTRRRKTQRGMPRFLNNWMSNAAKEQKVEQRKRPDDSWMAPAAKMTDEQCTDIWRRAYNRWRDTGSPHAKEMLQGCPSGIIARFEREYEARGKG